MLIAHIGLSKPIHWLVFPSDKLSVALKEMRGWSMLHPLTAIAPWDEIAPIHQFPAGDGGTLVSRAFLHCIVPEHTTFSNIDREAIKSLLMRLRHVSRQATMPRGDDISSLRCSDLAELPKVEFGEPYHSVVYRINNALFETGLTMNLVERAGELPTTFEPSVYEGILLDAFRAITDNDFRSAVLYGALAIEAMAGEFLEVEHAKLLEAVPCPPHIRAVEDQEGRNKGKREDPVFKWMRKVGRFPELLHELPLYVYQKSLKQEMPEVYQQARKLYQTRNALAHRGETAKDKESFPLDLDGAVDALKCVKEVFAWFGVPGDWSIPFEKAVDDWRSRGRG